MSLLLKNTALNGVICDIRVQKGIFTEISGDIDPLPSDTVLNAEKKIIIPSFKNGHTHSAMTLLRGIGDDMKLQPWLETKIWPMEAKMAADTEACYAGTAFACLEMIKSGTTFANDMYFNLRQNLSAFIQSGIKAAAGTVLFDFFDPEKREKQKKQCLEDFQSFEGQGLAGFCPAPHSVYTVSKELLKWTADFSSENNLPVHIHISETKKEVDDCIRDTGRTPVEYLKDIGFLGPNIAAAHCVWLSDDDIRILADYGVTVIYNPVSNMKLSVGKAFPYAKIKKAGIPVMLGTDGPASNNSVNMMEEMKAAALLQKHNSEDPGIMKAEEIFRIATGRETRVFPGISGEIAPGAPADFLLLNPDDPSLLPGYNIVSNIVYSADKSCIDTVVSNGRIIMRGGKIENEKEIINRFKETAARLIK